MPADSDTCLYSACTLSIGADSNTKPVYRCNPDSEDTNFCFLFPYCHNEISVMVSCYWMSCYCVFFLQDLESHLDMCEHTPCPHRRYGYSTPLTTLTKSLCLDMHHLVPVSTSCVFEATRELVTEHLRSCQFETVKVRHQELLHNEFS